MGWARGSSFALRWSSEGVQERDLKVDSKQFEELVARLAKNPSRRDALKGVLGGALSVVGLAAADGVAGKTRNKNKNKNKNNNTVTGGDSTSSSTANNTNDIDNSNTSTNNNTNTGTNNNTNTGT